VNTAKLDLLLGLVHHVTLRRDKTGNYLNRDFHAKGDNVNDMQRTVDVLLFDSVGGRHERQSLGMFPANSLDPCLLTISWSSALDRRCVHESRTAGTTSELGHAATVERTTPEDTDGNLTSIGMWPISNASFEVTASSGP